MALKKYKDLEITFPPEVSGLLCVYHDRVLAHDSLSDMDVLLLSIYSIEHMNKKTGVKYADCKDLFVFLGRKEDNYRKVVYSAGKASLIEKNVGELYLLIKGLERIEKILGLTGKIPMQIIKSGANLTAMKLFEGLLLTENKSREILLCDPYISSSTLFPFLTQKGKIDSMKILTSNILDSDKFREYKKKLEKEIGISIEVRISRRIHDRYLICDSRCWYIGSSIKDLGNKDTTLREMSEVVTSMRELFTERWNESS